MNILTQITGGKANISKANAERYTTDILRAIHEVKVFQEIINKEHPVRKQCSDDTIITTAPIELSGEMVSLKMAFSSESKVPCSAEIIKEAEE